MCHCNNRRCIDLELPRNVPLCPFYKRSFPYIFMRQYILDSIVGIMEIFSKKVQEHILNKNETGVKEITEVIEKIYKLRCEVEFNTPLERLQSKLPDAEYYNKYLLQKSIDTGQLAYFNSPLLFTEWYIFRRIRETFENESFMKKYHPLEIFNADCFTETLNVKIEYGTRLLGMLKYKKFGKDYFLKLLNQSLFSSDILCNSHEEYILLCDSFYEIWKDITKKTEYEYENEREPVINIICGKYDVELFADMCLADFIISNKLADKVVFQVKKQPIFLKDVSLEYIKWFLKSIKDSESEILIQIYMRWAKYLEIGSFYIDDNIFWSLPASFSQLSTYDPSLYHTLSKSKCIIIKGDMNYRRLIGDLNLNPTKPLNEVVQGFRPTNLIMLRSIVIGSVCGLSEEMAHKYETEDVPKFYVIQFLKKIVKQ